MLDFDFVTACENIVAAWDSVSIHLIEKCFHKSGFMCSVLTVPEAEPEPPRNIWDNMQQVLNAQVSFADYATADDAVETTKRLSDAEIVDWVKGRNQTEEEEEEEEDPVDDDDVISTSGPVADSTTAAHESEIIHTSTHFLHLIAQQKAYVLWNKLPLGTPDILNTVEQFVLASKLKASRTIHLLVTSLNKQIHVYDIKNLLFLYQISFNSNGWNSQLH